MVALDALKQLDAQALKLIAADACRCRPKASVRWTVLSTDRQSPAAVLSRAWKRTSSEPPRGTSESVLNSPGSCSRPAEAEALEAFFVSTSAL